MVLLQADAQGLLEDLSGPHPLALVEIGPSDVVAMDPAPGVSVAPLVCCLHGHKAIMDALLPPPQVLQDGPDLSHDLQDGFVLSTTEAVLHQPEDVLDFRLDLMEAIQALVGGEEREVKALQVGDHFRGALSGNLPRSPEKAFEGGDERVPIGGAFSIGLCPVHQAKLMKARHVSRGPGNGAERLDRLPGDSRRQEGRKGQDGPLLLLEGFERAGEKKVERPPWILRDLVAGRQGPSSPKPQKELHRQGDSLGDRMEGLDQLLFQRNSPGSSFDLEKSSGFPPSHPVERDAGSAGNAPVPGGDQHPMGRGQRFEVAVDRLVCRGFQVVQDEECRSIPSFNLLPYGAPSLLAIRARFDPKAQGPLKVAVDPIHPIVVVLANQPWKAGAPWIDPGAELFPC